MGATIAKADLLLVPKFDNLEDSIKRGLGSGAGAAGKAGEGLGRKTGSGFGRGLTASGAAIGAFSAITGKAMSIVSDHVGSAISRFDTLNNYPRTMQQLGYSAKEAEASIKLMSDRLQTMPTRLDDMAGTVKGIVAVTGDLGKATKVGLALNDMLVASGSNTQMTSAAMEQFRQILAKGKPEMQDWRSLTSAMPGQMDQLAKALLGPTANANNLYAALGGGKNDPTLTMDQLMDAIVRLDEQGGEGMSSFRQQAETAAGGIATAASNMSNAVTKGIAGTMDAIGAENITGVMNDVKSGINEAFKGINGFAKDAVPVVKGLYDSLKPIAPELSSAAGGFLLLNGAGSKAASVVSGVSSRLKEAGEGAGALKRANAMLGTSFTPVGLGIAAVSAALAIGATVYMDYQRKQELAKRASEGLNEVVSDTSSLRGYAQTIDDVGGKSKFTAMNVDELTEATAKHVDKMRENTEKAEAQISQLNTAQGIINAYAGQTDLSADAQGRLQWALQTVNDQLGLNISSQDVQNGQYTDADGNVRNLTQSLGDLIEKKKEEARVNAVTANLTEAYQARREASDALAKAEREHLNLYGDMDAAAQRLYENGQFRSKEEARAQAERQRASNREALGLDELEQRYKDTSDAVTQLSEELGGVSASSSEAADAFDRLGNLASERVMSTFKASGTSIQGFKDDLRALGADTEKLGTLSEEQMVKIAQSYDGTTSSIVLALRNAGVGMSEAGTKTADLSTAILTMGDDVKSAFEGSNVDVDQFAQKLAEAGVSTATLNEIGSANLAALAEACGGNMQQMTWFIQHYNDTPIVDKDGNVQVEDAELIDAQGNIWKWNGSSLVDQNGNAAVNDQKVLDAQGHLWTWNGSNLQYKDANGTVHDLMSGGIRSRDEWNKTGLNSYKAEGRIDIFKNITETVSKVFGVKNAAGGIRPHADGGIRPRYHARGAIATQAVPLDIVGEDGAEAIVPLTNRRYSQPFADIIAERFGERTDPATREIASLVRTLHADLGAILGAMPEGVSWRDFVRMTHKAVAASA